MNLDRAILAFAGTMILLSLLLGVYVSPYWFWFTAFVGANLFQSSFTGFCPMAVILRKLGVQPGAAFR
jgi:Inner membrane protein YgaP-like, transmembrane domain